MEKLIHYIAENAGKLSKHQIVIFNSLCRKYARGKASEQDFQDFINQFLPNI